MHTSFHSLYYFVHDSWMGRVVVFLVSTFSKVFYSRDYINFIHITGLCNLHTSILPNRPKVLFGCSSIFNFPFRTSLHNKDFNGLILGRVKISEMPENLYNDFLHLCIYTVAGLVVTCLISILFSRFKKKTAHQPNNS